MGKVSSIIFSSLCSRSRNRPSRRRSRCTCGGQEVNSIEFSIDFSIDLPIDFPIESQFNWKIESSIENSIEISDISFSACNTHTEYVR